VNVLKDVEKIPPEKQVQDLMKDLGNGNEIIVKLKE